ncbi:MAG: DNA-processing protein DprA [Clostridia bacterium]|nr:DNA-processing protein DprA [Clostridia bacterium]
MKDRLFEIWFALRCGIANKEFQPLLETYGTPYDLFNADEAELDKLPCSQNLKNRLADKSLREATRIMEFCKSNGVGLLFWQDEQYPASLRPLRDPPVLLYYKGRMPDLSRRLCISVVGTRSMSEYGKRMAYKIGYELGATGTVVVSGMALGNDSVAAAGAIAAGGQTVAVLGCGIDIVYPREHEQLFEEILKRGAVMTEYPPATPPEGRNFPVRNRLISGLSQGTVVIEGDLRSGSMITAKTAILQGRDIYAFPGNVGETNSAGTNQLISDGANIVLKARDVLENYTFLYRDALDMARLLKAETRSEPDEELLARLGVSVRTVPVKKSESQNFPAPPATQTKPRNTTYGRSSASRKASASESRPKTPERSTPPAKEPTPVSPHGDASERILKKLTDTQRRIFEVLPLDHAVPIDHITREGFTVGEVMATMTILEIHGLTVTLPGGLYARK